MSLHGHYSLVESPDVEKAGMRWRTSEGVSSLASIGCRRMWLRARIHSSRVFTSFAVVAFCLCAKALYTSCVSLRDTDNTLSDLREQRPLMVQLLGGNAKRLELVRYPPHSIEDEQNPYWINHGMERHNALDVTENQCVSMAKWQDEHHPSCLKVHEISLTDFHRGDQEQVRLVGDGGYRSVWMVREYDGTQRVLKTWKYSLSKWWNKTELMPRWFNRHRTDAVATEQLAASPYVADIYGYCANAALADYAAEGHLQSFIESKNRTKTESLRVAYHVAAAVADAHHVDNRKRATIAHTDINPKQFLLMNGVYKLNDFNRAQLLSWDPKRDKHCGFYFEYNLGPVSHDAIRQILICYRLLTR